MRDILLHICCGVCAAPAVEKLKQEGFNVRGFFYNPNIYPEAEYHARRETVEKVAQVLNIELLPDLYDPESFYAEIKGLENESEAGKRCAACFNLRLKRCGQEAFQRKIAKFTTTLTISPHKNSQVINAIGRKLYPQSFLAYDFKKQDGFKLAIEFSRSYNLYRQHYCGCEYSKNYAKETK